MRKISLLFALFSLCIGSSYAQCNCDWFYKTPITITNSGSSALTDYQVSVTVNTQSLVSDGKMLASGADIRFTDDACVNLPYYIESGMNTTTTKIWVKVNAIAASGPTTINMFYGNSSAAVASDPEETFLLFDDFDGSSLNTTKWSFLTSGGSQSVSGGAITISTSSYALVESNDTYESPYISEMKVNSVSGSWPNIAQRNASHGPGVTMFTNSSTMYLSNCSGWPYAGSFTYTASYGTGVGIWSLVRTPTNVYGEWPGGTITGTTGTLNTPSGNQSTAFGLLNGGSSNITVDWIRGRKYYAAGTVQSVGTETANGSGVITGTPTICNGSTTLLANAATGGTWTSGNATVASVSSTGLVTANSVGTAVISYTLGSCIPATSTVTVYPLPTAISGINAICTSTTSTLTSSPSGGVWSSTNGATASVTSGGTVSGLAVGTTVISYTFSGCAATSVVTVSTFGTPVTGTQSLCSGLNTSLANSVSGGTWSSTSTSIATINATTGEVSGLSAGTANITYTAPVGCVSPAVVTVNPLPALTVGPTTSTTICLNSATSFTAVSGGSSFLWSGVSGAAGLSCTSCASPTITPTAVGNNYYNVKATSVYGCESNQSVTILVNPLPAAITGLLNTCVGTTAPLMNADAGGTWSSSNASVAAIDLITGAMTGISTGTATISYTLPTGCVRTANVIVSGAPAPITGTPVVCSGMSTNLSHPVSGGAWSSSSAVIASVNSSGLVTGGSSGNATITYTLPSGCIATSTATVNSLPSAITGSSAVCQLETTTLSNADAGGTWSSSNSNASVGMFSGVVTGSIAGTSTISYTFSNGCYRTRTMTVNTLPAAITGSLATCYNTVSVLSDATFGGSWSSSNNSVAAIDASGLVVGLNAGTANISYTMIGSGCRAVAVFTVNPLPADISGSMNVCVGATTSLSNADGGGTWSSSNSGIASVDASGEVTGGAAGNVTITYTLATGCRKTAGFTVNPLPLAISGAANVCEGSTTTLYDFTPGGVWESGGPAFATIDGSGIVSGGSAGLANISYTLPTGCRRTVIVTVNSLPAAITGSLSVCSGQTSVLSNATGGGSWSSSTPGNASVGMSTGVVTGTGASGNAVITYTLPNGCSRSVVMNVNPLPLNITGPSSVCENSSITLSNGSPSGAWSSSDASVATVDGTGVVTGVSAGTVTISYALVTGCYRTKTIDVNPLPAAFTGNPAACVGQTSMLNSSTSGGAWTSSSVGIASVNSAGVVTGNSAGVANIMYTLSSTGCSRSMAFNVNPLPANIAGISTICEQSTTTLNSVTPGGIWSSSDNTIASISISGVVIGESAGSAMVSYTMPLTGCVRTKNVNVNPLPMPISGNLNVCVGMTTALGNSSPAGAWSSSSAGVATISSSGVVSGVSAGTANVTYTLPTSCRTSSTVVVNPLPSDITGSGTVCVGSSTMLSNGTINGNWSSSMPSVATVSASGMVTGMTSGSVMMTYTLPTGCYKTKMMTVNPLPAAITGDDNVCQGLVTGLSNASGGGSWSSSNTGLAPVSGAGVVTGVAPGVAVITYTLPTGCMQMKNIVVNPIPENITGVATVCEAGRTMMSTTTGGGFWGSASPIASISYLGEVTGVRAGTATVTYMLPTGCRRTRVVTVNPLPGTITGSSNVCEGSEIALSSTTAGGMWVSNSAAHATIDAGTGLMTGVSAGSVLISYTLPTGCMRTRILTVNTTPAAIVGTTEVCNGGVTTLTTTTTGGVWISDNTSVATVGLAGGNVTGISAGMAHISYSMPTGCFSSTMVQVNPQPSAIGGLLSICEGSTTVLTNSSLGGAWSSSTTGTASITAAGVVSGMTAGNSTISYTLPTGCYTTANLAVNSLPAVYSVTGGGNYCAGGGGVGVSLDGSSSLTTYKLYKGSTMLGTYTGSGAPIYFGMYTGSGMYTVSATNSAGCSRDMSGSAMVSITPVVTPFVNVTSSAGDTVCAGTSVTYGVMGVNGGSSPSYTWKVNGTVMSTGADSYVYSPAFGDIVSVTMASSAACALPSTATASKVLNVMSVETPSVTISASPSANVCAGTTVMYSASSANGGASPTYTWRKNGSTPLGSGATLSYVPNDNDNIVCWLNSSYRCLSVNNVVSNNILMNVDEVFVPEVTITVTPATTITQGEEAGFSAAVVNAGPTPSYQWMRNNVAIAGASQPTYSTKNLADGDVISCMVKGTGVCGESSMNSVTMTVEPSTGIAGTAVTVSELRLVPNPNNGTFAIRGNVAAGVTEPLQVEVTDMLGQVVYRTELPVENGSISKNITLGSNVANGMYMLNVTGADGGRNTIRFVVQQ